MKVIFVAAIFTFALINTADQSIHANAQMYLSGTNEYMGEVNFYMEEQPFGVVISGSVSRLRPSSVLVILLST